MSIKKSDLFITTDYTFIDKRSHVQKGFSYTDEDVIIVPIRSLLLVIDAFDINTSSVKKDFYDSLFNSLKIIHYNFLVIFVINSKLCYRYANSENDFTIDRICEKL